MVFVHDARFTLKAGNVYSNGALTASVWKRYLRHCCRLEVIGRDMSGGSFDEGWINSGNISDAPGVTFCFLPSLSGIRAMARWQGQVRRVLVDSLEQADAVIARMPSELGLLAVSAARALDKPYAVEVAGCGWDALWNYGNLKGRLYAPVMLARMRRAVARAPFVLYVTQDFLQRRYPNRSGVTVGCSNVAIAAPDVRVLERRLARISVESKPIVLGLIGTLKTKYKGIQTVLEALARERHRLPPIQFRVLGAGDMAPWQALAERHSVVDITRFDGVLPGGEPVLSWLDGVDVYLQPSFQEGLPRALIEAMSRGCPAIGSTCAGIPELLPPDCLIRPGDVRHLGALIVAAVQDRGWQAVQARRNWSVSKAYSRDILEERRDEFLRQLAATARAS